MNNTFARFFSLALATPFGNSQNAVGFSPSYSFEREWKEHAYSDTKKLIENGKLQAIIMMPDSHAAYKLYKLEKELAPERKSLQVGADCGFARIYDKTQVKNFSKLFLTDVEYLFHYGKIPSPDNRNTLILIFKDADPIIDFVLFKDSQDKNWMFMIVWKSNHPESTTGDNTTYMKCGKEMTKYINEALGTKE